MSLNPSLPMASRGRKRRGGRSSNAGPLERRAALLHRRDLELRQRRARVGGGRGLRGRAATAAPPAAARFTGRRSPSRVPVTTGDGTPPQADGVDQRRPGGGTRRAGRRLRTDADRRSPERRRSPPFTRAGAARCSGSASRPSRRMRTGARVPTRATWWRRSDRASGPAAARWVTRSCEAFRTAGHDDDRDRAMVLDADAAGRPHFDLWRANREQLEAAGMPAGIDLTSAGSCTRTLPGDLSLLSSAGIGRGPDGRVSIRAGRADGRQRGSRLAR